MTKYVQSQMKQFGLKDSTIEPVDVLLAYPVSRSLKLLFENGSVAFEADLSEPILTSDSTSDTWWATTPRSITSEP